MRRTSPLTLVVGAVLGLVAALLAELSLAAAGLAVVIPPITLAIALAAIGAIVVTMALPVRRSLRGGERVDPFYATRVVVLAKASSITGALLGGGGLGVLAYLLTRPATPALESVVPALVTVIGAVVLLVTGLVAEAMCVLPPEDDDQDDRHGGAAPSAR